MRTYKLRKCKRVHGLHFAGDGRRLLAVGGAEAGMVDSAVWLDLATGDSAGRIDQLARGYAVAPDGSRLVFVGVHRYRGGGAPLQWTPLPDFTDGWRSVPEPATRGRTLSSFSELWAIAFDPSGDTLIVGHGNAHRRTADLGVYEWEMGLTQLRFDTGEVVQRLSVSDLPGVFAFAPDGTRLAVSGGSESAQPEVTVLEFPGGRMKFCYLPSGTRTRCLTFLPDGRLVAANARNVYVFPPDGPEPQFVLAGHKGQVNAIAAFPDGRRLLSASHDGVVGIWDPADGRETAALDWKIGPVTALAFAPDGLTCAAAAGAKGQVVLWDVEM